MLNSSSSVFLSASLLAPAEARDVPNVRAWLVDAARGGARVGDGCALRVDGRLNFLERLFCAACGVELTEIDEDEGADEGG